MGMDLFQIVVQAVSDPAGPFQEGAGIPIARYRGYMLVGLTISLLCWLAWVIYGLAQSWAAGQMKQGDLIRDVVIAIVMVVVMLIVFGMGL